MAGSVDFLPAVTLTVESEGGKLQGAILFFLMRRGAGTATPGVPEPLIDPRFDGKTLTFAVSRRYANPPQTFGDPPVTFRVELSGANKSKLFAADGPGVDMVRDRY